MASNYDHFHAEFEHDGVQGEIEGGWTGVPDNWDEMSKEERNSWINQLCINWGMPEGASVRHLWLAG